MQQPTKGRRMHGQEALVRASPRPGSDRRAGPGCGRLPAARTHRDAHERGVRGNRAQNRIRCRCPARVSLMTAQYVLPSQRRPTTRQQLQHRGPHLPSPSRVRGPGAAAPALAAAPMAGFLHAGVTRVPEPGRHDRQPGPGRSASPWSAPHTKCVVLNHDVLRTSIGAVEAPYAGTQPSVSLPAGLAVVAARGLAAAQALLGVLDHGAGDVYFGRALYSLEAGR